MKALPPELQPRVPTTRRECIAAMHHRLDALSGDQAMYLYVVTDRDHVDTLGRGSLGDMRSVASAALHTLMEAAQGEGQAKLARRCAEALLALGVSEVEQDGGAFPIDPEDLP